MPRPKTGTRKPKAMGVNGRIDDEATAATISTAKLRRSRNRGTRGAESARKYKPPIPMASVRLRETAIAYAQRNTTQPTTNNPPDTAAVGNANQSGTIVPPIADAA